jgi:mRNA-degrading endonuclease RelE of RelBE toxin-antitoxin system
LSEDPFLEAALPLKGHRNHYRVRFYGDQYRIIYRVSHSQRKVIVTRIRRRDSATYTGYEVIKLQ